MLLISRYRLDASHLPMVPLNVYVLSAVVSLIFLQ